MADGERHWMPCLVFRRPGETPDFKVGIFAGVHGDEPAGVLALCDLVTALEVSPVRGRGYELQVYPLVNPTGYEDGTRESRSGKDLNREFWRGSLEPEVAFVEREILREKYHGHISLHSDDTSEGFYAFAQGTTLTEHLLRPTGPENFAGHEIDVTVNWNAAGWLKVQAGYRHFFAGDYLSDTGPSDDADFGYVQAAFSF